MKLSKESIKTVSKHLVKRMVADEMDRWPPICTSLLYQPERPVKVHDTSLKTERQLKNGN